MDSDLTDLTQEDVRLFDSYKESILIKIKESFPTLSVADELKPISVDRQIGCGTFYRFKVCVSENQFVYVSFHLGGKRATPMIGPPHFEITMTH